MYVVIISGDNIYTALFPYTSLEMYGLVLSLQHDISSTSLFVERDGKAVEMLDE